jgi:trimeric autotransporter adhesin
MMRHKRPILGIGILLLASMLVPTLAQSPSPGTILTVAGGAPVNVPALSISFEAAASAKDSAGNIYTASPDFSLVFKITPSGKASVLAGNGVSGYSGDGGPATSAQLGCPTSVAVDAANDVFIADPCENVVREVLASNGNIHTLAGNGTGGYLGDGGAATSAELSQPSGVSVDAAGDILIADTGNDVVRDVVCGTAAGSCTPPAGDTSGDIYTVAGNGTAGYSGDAGPATAATLSGPFDMATDVSGDIFIADTGNSVIREVACGTDVSGCAPPTGDTAGDIYTVAGDGTPGISGDGGPAINAELNFPQGISLDSAGDFFIADTQNNEVREVSGGTINTVAGDGAPGFGGDGGSATNAELANPIGIAVDPSGDLIIGDAGNDVMREVSGGIINTIAGNGFPSYSGDGAAATNAQFAFPFGVDIGVAADSAGDFFVSDSGASVVREVVASTGDIKTLVGNGLTGFSGDNGPATSAMLDSPSGVALDSAGDVFIADSANNVIREVSASTGMINTVAGNHGAGYTGDGGPATSATMNQPLALALDNAGDLFISDTFNNVVREVICATGATGCAPPAGKTSGDIYTIAGNGTAGFSGDGGAATSAELQQPKGLSMDSSGDIFIADSANNRIREISQGTINTVAGNGTPGYTGDKGPALSATVNQPYAVLVDDPGNLFIGDTNNHVIREVVCATATASCTPPSGETTGDIYTIAGNGTAGFSGDGGPAANALLDLPLGMAIDSSGGLLFADLGANRIRVVTGLATVATADLSASSVTFTPAQVLGASAASQVVTLSNPGTASLTISGISESGSTDFSQSNNCGNLPATLAPSTSCNFTVTFLASSTGPHSGAITLTDNASNSPQMIPLSGAGIVFTLAAASGGSTSATVSAGQKASYSLQASATGGFTPNDQLGVTIACTGAPQNATCSGPTSPVTATPSTPGAFTVTVQTAAGSEVAPMIPPAPWQFQMLLALIFFALALVSYFLWNRARHRSAALLDKPRRAKVMAIVPLSLLAMSMVCVAGCGTSSSNHTGGTPPGTYTLTLQGTADGVSHNLQLTLNVQ